MFRKGSLPITLLSVIFSTLFFRYVESFSLDIAAVSIVIFLVYFVSFMTFFGSIYDIIHKVKIKANRYLLGNSICEIIAFTAFFKSVEYSSVYLGIISAVAFVCSLLLAKKGNFDEIIGSPKEN